VCHGCRPTYVVKPYRRWVVEKNLLHERVEAFCIQNLGMECNGNIFKFGIEWRGM